jgi:DNA-binding CsgD family transcriptional regulator
LLTIGRPGTSTLLVEALNRELEIRCSEGLSPSDVGARLHLSVHTIDTYRRRMRIKLQLEPRPS